MKIVVRYVRRDEAGKEHIRQAVLPVNAERWKHPWAQFALTARNYALDGERIVSITESGYH